ncbi:retrovirus-related pol polyprotein from transposon TNT 1-94 [Tanacetum coccineum]|uniref:Retrovirus-related pol polyprotein from transposon TNT 1-94 n=1 Tax=Tanacetum coccineum TaxID=301880 RepID=A0ABQ5EYI3_9ASTR
MTESPLVDSGFDVPDFSPRDDPIACLNKAMAFITAVASSRGYKVKVILVRGIRVMLLVLGGNNASGHARVVKCYNCQGEGHMARQCTQPKRQGMQHDPGVPDGQAIQTIIPNNAAFQTKDLDTYDSDYLCSREKMIDSQIDDMIKEKIALKEQVDSLEQNLSKQIKKGMFIVNTHSFKSESKEKEDKYLENETGLEKKIKELDNILFKVGRSAQTVHMLTKPHAFYDNIHKQALGYQNPFHLKKAMRIKPTLNDGIVMSDKHVAMPVIDNEETLILEEESRSKMSEKAKDPEVINKNISHKPIDYENKPSDALPVKIEAPKELPKISLVNQSLKNLKFHLAKFDNVVKIRTTPNARTEDLEPLAPRLLQNREAHIDYLKYTQEQVYILRGIVKQAKAKQPLDKELDFACKHAQRIQELLVYVRDTCPNAINLSATKVVVTPKNKVKKVRFAEPLTSSSNIKQVESSKTSDSNTPVLSSTGLKCSTSKCGSKPTGNKKNDRISRPSSRNMKNKVRVKKAKIVESKNANHSKPNHTWGFNATDIPSSSFLVMTVRFENDHIARIIGYGDYQLGNVTISRVYCVEGLRQGVDLLSGSRDTNLYTISLEDMLKKSPICLISKASKTKSWLWHYRLSHLNFGTINKLVKDGLARGIPRHKFQKDHLCSACALGKSKKSSHQPKAEETNQEKLYLLHMDLCGLIRVASINEKRYILVIVDDYSRFTWVRFLRTKDEAPKTIIKCIKNIQVFFNATVCNVRTDNGTKFVNQTLHEFYENVGISHQTSFSRTPQQNGVVERRNQTLVEAARTMLIFSKALLFLRAKAINIACYTQNCSIIHRRYNKTPYELMQDKKPDLSFFYVFGALCYPTNDNDDLGKLDAKADIGIFVGYAPIKKAFRIYNKRTQELIETIHVTFDELIAMASEQFSSGLGLHYMTPTTSSSGLVQNTVSQQPFQEAIALRVVDLDDSLVSTSID